jgi:DNA-binding MarR family transcriptional regulator
MPECDRCAASHVTVDRTGEVAEKWGVDQSLVSRVINNMSAHIICHGLEAKSEAGA